MSKNRLKVVIEKERFKFAAAHMTIFPDRTKENLHGHNYQVGLSIELKQHRFEDLISFHDFKKCLEPICERLDEKVLLASKNPLSKLSSNEGYLHFEVLSKKYKFPEDEVEILPVENITTELLSGYICTLYVASLRKELGKSSKQLEQILSVEVTVKESFGQHASTFQEL